MRLYQIDAFTSELFGGNPAAVVPLEDWPDDSLLQAIAAENNLAETAFFVPSKTADYHLRWFTPTNEVQLCGHATLATAWALFHRLDFTGRRVHFNTASGPLTVTAEGDWLTLTLPAWPPEPVDAAPGLLRALGVERADAVLQSRDTIVVLDNETAVRALRPDLNALEALDLFGVAVTAPGDAADVVYRFFAPNQGIPEDPVTGSACSSLVPFWCDRLGRERLDIHQVSRRGGELLCHNGPEKITVSGRGVCYLAGELSL